MIKEDLIPLFFIPRSFVRKGVKKNKKMLYNNKIQNITTNKFIYVVITFLFKRISLYLYIF